MRLTEQAQAWLQPHIRPGDIVVDATLGNGWDALFLARCVGGQGMLYGFDTQAQAINNSKQRLENTGCKKALFQIGHEHMATHIPERHHGKIRAIMFNLGWLPHGNKQHITQASTTLPALRQAITLLSPTGRLSIMAYPGHSGGDDEAKQVLQWTKRLSHTHSCDIITLQHRHAAPILVRIERTFDHHQQGDTP